MFYLPLLLWMVSAPYSRHFRGTATGPKRAVRLRAFSGVTVGLLGSVTNTHVSLALSALAFVGERAAADGFRRLGKDDV